MIEVKSDAQVDSAVVTAKWEAARKWANVVNDNTPEGTPRWGYVLAYQADLMQAHGSWPALLRLTGAV